MSPFLSQPDTQLVHRIQREFIEMPGLRLTMCQAQRLMGLEAACCETLLTGLVEAKFLARGLDGQFIRVLEDGGATIPRYMVKATLSGEPSGTRRKETA